MGFTERLTAYVRAGYPAIVVDTAEERRASGDVLSAAKEAKRGLATWSATEGLKVILPAKKEVPDTSDLLAATQNALALEDTVLVLRDAQSFPFDRDPVLARSLRDLIDGSPGKGRTVIFLGPKFTPYPSIEKLCQVLDYTLPSEADLKRVVAGIAKSCKLKDDGNGDVLRALSGLSVSEAENALSLAFIESGRFDPAVIYREKCAAVGKTGLLEIVNPDPRGLDSIGGLATLKGWIAERKAAYSPEAEAYGLPPPKGCLIVGVPGTGKSLASKAFGTALGVPTLRLDMGAMFGSLVGESERRMREALALAEAISPVVLWCEEIEKSLAGSGGSGNTDGGTTKRVFGTLLTWLQERRKPVFLVATANDISQLPPELSRRGRFDEIWSVDLPTEREREDIVDVQLNKHVKDQRAFDTIERAKIAKATEGYTGAEIEAAVVGALYRAFADKRRPPTTADVIESARKVVPLSTMAKDQIASIRRWAKQNARNAGESAPDNAEEPGGRVIG